MGETLRKEVFLRINRSEWLLDVGGYGIWCKAANAEPNGSRGRLFSPRNIVLYCILSLSFACINEKPQVPYPPESRGHALTAGLNVLPSFLTPFPAHPPTAEAAPALKC